MLIRRRANPAKFAIVHNGVIENYLALKSFLTEQGHHFVSETDTEVVAQLLDYYYEGDLLDAIVKTLRKIRGSYALGILCSDFPDRIIGVRKESPLIVGLGKGENFIASDIPAILNRTRDIYRLEENEIAVIQEQRGHGLRHGSKKPSQKKPCHIDWDISAAEKGGYDHFMAKEIMEQPKAVRDTISPRIKDGRIVLDNVHLTKARYREFQPYFYCGLWFCLPCRRRCKIFV